MSIFKNNAFSGISTESVITDNGIVVDPNVTFSDVAEASNKVMIAFDDISTMSLQIATESTILFANALEGQKVSETPGISTEAVEGFGIEEGDDAADEAKKAQKKKVGDYVKMAGDAIIKALKALGAFFSKLGQAVINFFKIEGKLWEDLLTKSLNKTEKPTGLGVTLPIKVDSQIWNGISESYEEYIDLDKASKKEFKYYSKIADKIGDPLFGTEETPVEQILKTIQGLKFASVSITKVPSLTNRAISKFKKGVTPEESKVILKSKQISMDYGSKVQSLLNIVKRCRVALDKEVSAGKNVTNIVKLGKTVYNTVKKVA